MAYIYCITNLINGKRYIGKTTYSVTKRFQEHCRDSQKERYEKRPLYRAMNKYGVKNFIVEELIQCDELELSSYEIFFIEKYNTYGKTGYNATKGGDGSLLFDYKQILKSYENTHYVLKTATEIGCSVDTVRKVLQLYGITIEKHFTKPYSEYSECINTPVKVVRLDKNSEKTLEIYESIALAAHWLVDNGYAKTYNGGIRQKISMCCRGKLKTAYKFKWKLLN